MAKKVNLDAMIPRADFALVDDESKQERITSFGIEALGDKSPIFRGLRKPDFQRETNHWTAKQICDLVKSFLDDELVPSLILWESTAYIFVIDGGHRLSALKAWIADDYGDGLISQRFYNGVISRDQKQIARTTRNLVEREVGRYSELDAIARLEDPSSADAEKRERANRLFRRVLTLQWVFGTKEKAESSFYKINSQGTILDDVETSLIKNRKKPIAIAARSIIRAGSGHKYSSDFTPANQEVVKTLSAELYNILFEPEADSPLKTLDVPLGGSVSPIDALALLIELLAITGRPSPAQKRIDEYDDDATGQDTVALMKRSIKVIKRMTTNDGGSLGLHPAVYYYSAQGKHNRFLLLGMAQLISTAVINNDSGFFKKFTGVRSDIETFLLANKGLVTLTLQNLHNKVRVTKVADMFSFLIKSFILGDKVTPVGLLEHLGIGGTVYELNQAKVAKEFSDAAKSQTYVSRAIAGALKCPECSGLISPIHSISYDHDTPAKDGGVGSILNCELMHPYCNTGMKGGKSKEAATATDVPTDPY